MALCSCQGGKRTCKFHPRESLSLHPPHQERIDTIPQTYAKISRNLTKGWRGLGVGGGIMQEKQPSLAENFSEEVVCANLGLKEKYSTLLKLLRWQGKQGLHWPSRPPWTYGCVQEKPKQTSSAHVYMHRGQSCVSGSGLQCAKSQGNHPKDSLTACLGT